MNQSIRRRWWLEFLLFLVVHGLGQDLRVGVVLLRVQPLLVHDILQARRHDVLVWVRLAQCVICDVHERLALVFLGVQVAALAH